MYCLLNSCAHFCIIDDYISLYLGYILQLPGSDKVIEAFLSRVEKSWWLSVKEAEGHAKYRISVIYVIFHSLVFSAKKGDIAVPDVCIYHSQISAGLAVGFWQHSGSNSNSLCLDANHWNVFRIEFWFEFLFIGTSVAIVSLLCPTAQAHQTWLRSWANSVFNRWCFFLLLFSRFPWCHPHPLPCQTTMWVMKMKHCAACCCPGTWVATTLDTIRYIGLISLSCCLGTKFF